MVTLDLQDNATLRMQAANEAGLENDDFGIENFTYANHAIVNTVFGHLEDTDFNGLVVSVYLKIIVHNCVTLCGRMKETI